MKNIVATFTLAVASLSACSNTTQNQATPTAIVDAVVCASDLAAIQGKALSVAVGAVKDPNCLAALTALLNAGASPSAIVTPTAGQ